MCSEPRNVSYPKLITDLDKAIYMLNTILRQF